MPNVRIAGEDQQSFRALWSDWVGRIEYRDPRELIRTNSEPVMAGPDELARITFLNVPAGFLGQLEFGGLAFEEV